jgi:hypothetical protein
LHYIAAQQLPEGIDPSWKVDTWIDTVISFHLVPGIVHANSIGFKSHTTFIINNNKNNITLKYTMNDFSEHLDDYATSTTAATTTISNQQAWEDPEVASLPKILLMGPRRGGKTSIQVRWHVASYMRIRMV